MQLKAIIRRAREEGDIDTETEAQERLMQLSMEQRQLQQWEDSRPEPQSAPEQQQAPTNSPHINSKRPKRPLLALAQRSGQRKMSGLAKIGR